MLSACRLRRWLDTAYPRRRAKLVRRLSTHDGPFADGSTGIEIPVHEADDPPR